MAKTLRISLVSTKLSASHQKITQVVQEVESRVGSGFNANVRFQYVSDAQSIEGLSTYYNNLPSIIFWWEGDNKPAHVIDGADTISVNDLEYILAERFKIESDGYVVNVFGIGKQYIPYFAIAIVLVLALLLPFYLKVKKII